MRQVVIIGGGVAGLSALNRLVDLGISAILIEGGDYPSHKICGEFFSPECLPILKQWDLCPSLEISHISLIGFNRSFSFQIQTPARSQSRFSFDYHLAERAKRKGASLLTKTQVDKIETGQKKIYLKDGKSLIYTDLILSTGRFFKGFHPEYIGIKGHLEGIKRNNELEMFLFKGGYAGLSPIEGGMANFACLLKKSEFNDSEPLKRVFQLSPQLEKRLKPASLVFKEWMSCEIPRFGIKTNPCWSDSYFIGDAAGSIPPASGLGLSLAMTSGYMVGEYVLKRDSLNFRKTWEKKYRGIFRKGQLLHNSFMNPLLSSSAIKLGQLFSFVGTKVFEMTRIPFGDV